MPGPTDPGSLARQANAVAGFGFPYTVDPGILRATPTDALSVQVANTCVYQRVLHGGTISKVGVWVAAQSGNISVAVYRNTGTGRSAVPDARAATSGAVACPVAGYAEVALGGSVTVNPGDWLAISADNSTATFHTMLGAIGDNLIGLGRQFRQTVAHPAPATAASLIATVGYTMCLVGVA